MQVQIKCKGSFATSLESLEVIQGDLKELSEENYNKLKSQILELGFSAPFFVWKHDGKNKLCDGTQRSRALICMKEEGITMPEEFPCVEIEAKNLKEAKKKILAISSNYGTMTTLGLESFMKDVDMKLDDVANSFTFDAIDFDVMAKEIPVEQLAPVEGEDDVPEIQPDPIAKRGDVWLLGDNRVMCGDSTMIDDVEKLMDGEKADMLFTSPPYADMREYNGNKDLSIENLIEFIPTYLPYTNFQVVNLGIQRKEGNIVEYWQEYIDKSKSCGYNFMSWNVWDKGEAGSIGNQTAVFPICHEWVFVFGNESIDINKNKKNKDCGNKNHGTRRNKDGTTSAVTSEKKTREYGKRGTALKITPHKHTSLNPSVHPAMFPVGLPEAYIQDMSTSKGIVIEPFCGSGTTILACEKTSRKCYGMELDEKYVDVIIKRWQKFTDKEATLESTGKTFNELFEARK